MERETKQYHYAVSSKYPAKRIEILEKVLEKLRPFITVGEVSTLQEDATIMMKEVVYRQEDDLFEIVRIEKVEQSN